ncbi:MAG: hypothetical protein AAFY91_00465 [Bacteroidota bacterium]
MGNARRQISLFFNSKQVEGSIAEISKKKRQLINEMRQLSEGSEEYNNKLREIKKLQPVLDKHRQNLRSTSQSYNMLNTGLGKFVGLAAGAFAVDRIFSYGTALFNTAAEMEVLGRKAETVFAEALPQVTAAAERNATAMGLTASQYTDAATAIGDLLVPMGFMRTEAADVSTQLVDLSGALAEWTGGQISSEQATNILSKALLGEREQLKTLGISIKEADVQNRLREKGLDNLTGKYLEQAKAIATMELILEKSTDAQAAFEENSDTLVRRQAELNARFEEVREKLATALIPVFEKLVDVANLVADGMEWVSSWFDTSAESARKAADEVLMQKDSFDELEGSLNPLLSRYEELTTKTELSAAEQAELSDIITQIGNKVPNAITQIDEYGNAIGISTDVTKEFIEAQRENLELVRDLSIEQNVQRLEELNMKQQELQTTIERGTELQSGFFGLGGERPLSVEAYRELQQELRITTEQILEVDRAQRELLALERQPVSAPAVDDGAAGSTDTQPTPEQLAEIERERAAAEQRAEQQARAEERRLEQLRKDQQKLAEELEGFREEQRLARLDDDDRQLEELRISTQEKIDEAARLEAAGVEGATQQRIEAERQQQEALKALSNELAQEQLQRQEEENQALFEAEMEQQAELLEERRAIEEEINENERELFMTEAERAVQDLDIYYQDLLSMAKQYGLDVEQVQRQYQAAQESLQKEHLEKTRAKQVEELKKQADALAESYGALGSLASSAFDLIKTAGLEGTAVGKLVALAEIGFNSAKGVSAAIAAGAGIPFPGNLPAIASGVAAVTGGIAQASQILNSTPVPQRYFGGYFDVTGETDGRHYRARLLNQQGTGLLPPYPVLLASERGQEYIIRNQDLSNPAVLNHVRAIENIRTYGTPQYNEGGFTSTASPAPVTTTTTTDDSSAVFMAQAMPVLAQLATVLDNLQQSGIPAYIGDEELINARNRTGELLESGNGVI